MSEEIDNTDVEAFDTPDVTENLGASASGWLSRLLPVLLALVLVAATLWSAAIFGLTVYRDYLSIPGEVEVPEVVGLEIRDAYEKIESQGLRLQVHESRHDKTVPKRTVLSQNPTAGRPVRQGRTVLVSVSLGPELIQVPAVVGESLRSAKITISNSKLRVGKVTFEEPTYGLDEEVLNQNPSSGKDVLRGQEVNLHVRRAWR